MTTSLMATPASPPVLDLLARFRVAQTLRQPMESVWRDCADYTLPYRNENGALIKNAKLFDGTAGDAVDQLASSLLAQLTPPWSSWIAIAPGPSLTEQESAVIAPRLREVNEIFMGVSDAGRCGGDPGKPGQGVDHHDRYGAIGHDLDGRPQRARHLRL